MSLRRFIILDHYIGGAGDVLWKVKVDGQEDHCAKVCGALNGTIFHVFGHDSGKPHAKAIAALAASLAKAAARIIASDSLGAK
jgi:hypothetical protein